MNITEKIDKYLNEGFIRRFLMAFDVISTQYGTHTWQNKIKAEVETMANKMFGKKDPRYDEIVSFAKELSMRYDDLSDKEAKKKLKENIKKIDDKFNELKNK